MKTTTVAKDKTIRFVVHVKPVAKGHQPHRSGSGAHRHKNDRRQGNRSQRTARAVAEY